MIFRNQKTKMRYICNWPKKERPEICGMEFDQPVGRTSKISDRVVCPRCGGWLKTWEDGRPLTE
ncbi:MAG: hypothetical protein Q8O88_01110 [bacterium]|nr:hypothetical protein [bacterium]